MTRMLKNVPPVDPSRTQELVAAIGSQASTKESKVRRMAAAALPPLGVFAAMIVAWYAITYLALSPDRRFLLPAPHEVIINGFGNPIIGPAIVQALKQTAGVAASGLLAATVVGIPWGIAMSRARWIERSLFPYAVLLQCIPILALVPLVGFWFGFGFPARVVVCAMMALFPMVSNTLFGLSSIDPHMRELFALHHAGRWKTLTKLETPAALPAVFAGLRISAGLSVVGAIVADFFFRQGEPGIGAAISRYQSLAQGEALFAAIISAALLGVVVFVMFGWMSQRLVGRWHSGQRR